MSSDWSRGTVAGRAEQHPGQKGRGVAGRTGPLVEKQRGRGEIKEQDIIQIQVKKNLMIH